MLHFAMTLVTRSPGPSPAPYSVFQHPHLQNGIPTVSLFVHRVGVRIKRNSKSLSVSKRAFRGITSYTKPAHNVKTPALSMPPLKIP